MSPTHYRACNLCEAICGLEIRLEDGEIASIRERGGEVVVIDPRRTRTAKLASRHHFVRPGTDALLLAERVELASRVGGVTVPLELTDAIMPGVASLPHGWGHGRDGIRLQTASSHPGVSANDVTDPALVDALSGNAVVNGVPVEISPEGAEA